MTGRIAVEDVALWWIGEGKADERVMDAVRARIEEVFGPPVRVLDDPQRPPNTLDPRRGQHSSTGILRWLLTARPPGGGRLVAVTDADLFIPVLTFVFGEATLGGGVAVVSSARLGAGPGRTAGPAVLVPRLAKECIHELGHAFGLIHCGDPRCVMARSASLVHVDAKSGSLCRDCRIRLRECRRSEGGQHGQ